MGYFSELAAEERETEREPGYPGRREILQYFLDDLEARLDVLNVERPHDPMDPGYDRYFYSDCVTHYYENPNTVQDILFCIAEVTALIREMEEEERVFTEEPVAQLSGQLSFFSEHCDVIDLAA